MHTLLIQYVIRKIFFLQYLTRIFSIITWHVFIIHWLSLFSWHDIFLAIFSCSILWRRVHPRSFHYLLYILCNICIFVTKTWHVLIIHLGTFTFFQTWHFSSHIFIYTLKASTSALSTSNVCSILCNICIFGTKLW